MTANTSDCGKYYHYVLDVGGGRRACMEDEELLAPHASGPTSELPSRLHFRYNVYVSVLLEDFISLHFLSFFRQVRHGTQNAHIPIITTTTTTPPTTSIDWLDFIGVIVIITVVA